MTKKLTDWDKNANKMRRSSLLFVKKLLKDKSVNVHFGIDHEIIRTVENKLFHTGQHKVTLDWWAKVK